MKARITLARAIRELRTQLAEAAVEGEKAAIRFVPKSVEVELGITFEAEAEAGGGFKLFSLIDLSAKAKAGQESTHKVKLMLEPVGHDGKSIKIGDSQREKD
jgi:NTP-dependent ternary system trypsin peptidase co-occuring protein